MRAAEIIREVTLQGGSIDIDSDILKLSAPRPLPDDLMDEIRRHKSELIAELAPLPHGPCYQCGTYTACMLARPNSSWDWQCIPCFDRGARTLPMPETCDTGEMVRPI